MSQSDTDVGLALIELFKENSVSPDTAVIAMMDVIASIIVGKGGPDAAVVMAPIFASTLEMAIKNKAEKGRRLFGG